MERYAYSADGNKLRTTYTVQPAGVLIPMTKVMQKESLSNSPASIQTLDYCGNTIYDNGSLSSIQIQGGFITKNDNQYRYHYYIADHLGNNRIVASENGTIEQTNHYYPFGALFGESTNDSKQRYKYNGKELDRMNGLNLYDYGARNYDAALTRWTCVDPMCEKYYSVSPYVYCLNNPVNAIDPDGKKPTAAEAARMAAHVYGDKNNNILIGGWRISQRNFNIPLKNDAGLKSMIYERAIKGKATEYAYATAGTEDWKDVVNDMKQPLGLSEQYSNAAENAQTLSDALGKTELTFVGHSLGGGEAALNALVTKRDAITFNAAGVSVLTKYKVGDKETLLQSEQKIDAYTMTTDPLNIAQDTSLLLPDVNGTRIFLFPKDNPSIYNGHSMDNVLKKFPVPATNQ